MAKGGRRRRAAQEEGGQPRQAAQRLRSRRQAPIDQNPAEVASAGFVLYDIGCLQRAADDGQLGDDPGPQARAGHALRRSNVGPRP